ncbi:MAG: hypothetical protein ACPGOY_02005 [Rhodospirillaceae bacterium]
MADGGEPLATFGASRPSENQSEARVKGTSAAAAGAAAARKVFSKAHAWRRRRRRAVVLTRKGGALTIGWLLVGVGTLLTPTPVPIGIIMIAVGLYMVARHSAFARRGIVWFRERVPRFSKMLNAQKPRFGKGFKRFIERTDPEKKRKKSGGDP